MKKKLVLVAAPPACGKTYASELIAKNLEHTVYLDKDDLSELVRTSFAVADEAFDMDGDFYITNIRASEYSTILNIALSSLRFEDTVILNAPFGKEVRDSEYIRSLKRRVNSMNAELILIWVSAPTNVCRERMAKRGYERDLLKLASWDDYVKKINYTAPVALEEDGCVDKMMIFDTTNDVSVSDSLNKALELIKD